jgi:murein DD-endopeptidase MepM/ murein hydrolase activator NlpD
MNLLPVLPVGTACGAPHVWITSRFGPRVHPVTGRKHEHTGIDIRVPAGHRILAVATGRIVRVDTDGRGRGKVNGNAVFLYDEVADRLYCYLHLSESFAVKGDRAIPGTLLGLTGATGRTTGPHLHFQIHGKNGVLIDPATLFPGEWLKYA